MRALLLVALVIVLAGGGATASAQRRDPALSVAGEIAQRVARFPNFRGAAAHGRWQESAERAWSIRDTAACHAALGALGVPFEAMRTRQTPIPAPVRITGAIGGVTFRKLRGGRLIVACELAARLPAIAAVLAEHDVREVRVLSAWRTEPSTSFHTMGLALDLHSFVRAEDTLVVERDYAIQHDTASCEGDAPTGERAAALRAIACGLAESGVLSTVITPAYSPGHRDHLHVDARPDDRRLFVR